MWPSSGRSTQLAECVSKAKETNFQLIWFFFQFITLDRLKEQVKEKDEEIKELQKKLVDLKEAQRKAEIDEKDKVWYISRDFLHF